MIRAECKFQICVRLAIPNLTSSRWCPKWPRNALAARIRRLDRHCPSGESVTENIRHVVPNLVAI